MSETSTVQPTPDDRPKLLTAEEAAAILTVPKSWVYRAAREGELPVVRLGRYRRFRRSDIERIVQGGSDAA